MRVDRILRLADRVENVEHVDGGDLDFLLSRYHATFAFGEPTGFNMSFWSCGTVACLAGHAAWMAKCDPEYDFVHGDDIYEMARDYLSLDRDVATDLFMPDHRNDIQPKDAAGTLRHLASTGEVSWRKYTCVKWRSVR